MADRRRIVTKDAAGTPTTVLDLATVGGIESIRDAFRIVPPGARPVVAQGNRRYQGGRTVGETHENGKIVDTLLVQGTTADACLDLVSDLLEVTRAGRTDLFFEWRPEGATYSAFYEIRGPGGYDPGYRWVVFAGARVLSVSIEIPVAPLAHLTPISVPITSMTLPGVVALTGIPGDAPALADVTLRTSGGALAPIWALIGWVKHPTVAPIASSVAPFGIIEAETAVSLSTWAAVADAAYRGGNGIRVNTAGAGNASASFPVDPSVLAADDFSRGELDVEVWAEIELAAGVVTPRLILSLEPNAGTSFGQPTYTPEFQSVGKILVKPATATNKRFVRLGVLTMPVDPATPLRWNVRVQGTWAAGSTGLFGLDYLTLVPARRRACSKTGVANDSYYPKFIASTADTRKTIRGADLSGMVGSAALNQGRDGGLGGSPIELPPGDVDLLLKLSSMVPDDPTVQDLSEQLAHTGVTGTVVITPRVHLARGL